ncbi:NUDIX hydrolase [Sanguibacter suaedae]|uniref:NUDIX domain-containing protein n=1 Tax=Sanguibacter suaedae TaxID=2795737 RepID=A0A934MBL6_9MICO|nr:NUDIX domain-containing protein [Sanguibacter suaedae]MBI9115451.1 NUDIX domain-containing protein [Sanguibacter suaedae]
MSTAAVDRFRVVPAAYVVLLREGEQGPEVLLQLRRGTGYMDDHWACAAAGYVEQGESVLDAAVREAREELGIVVDPAELDPVTVMHRTTPGGGPVEERVDFFFRCRTWSGSPVLQEADKAADLRWVPLACLPEPVVPHERAVLDGMVSSSVTPVTTFGFPVAPRGRAFRAT